MKTIDKIVGYVRSGQAGMVLTSVEPEECFNELIETVRLNVETDESWELSFWDPADGLTDIYGNNITASNESVDEELEGLGLGSTAAPKVTLHEAMEIVLHTIRDRQSKVMENIIDLDNEPVCMLCIRNFDRLLAPAGMQGPVDTLLLSLSQKIINEGQSTKMFLLMQTSPDFELPIELAEHCEFIRHDLPEAEERETIIAELGVPSTKITQSVLAATAGLSRAKTAQYSAETLASFGYLEPVAIFRKKAMHLSRNSKLDVWSPDFIERIKLWPKPELEEFVDAADVNMINEETHINNKHLAENEVRVRVQYVKGSGTIERWLDPMPKEKFEEDYRPNRNFYSFDSVIGLEGLKSFLRKGSRQNIPLRARMRHIMMLGVPGTGKSHTMRCASGELSMPISEMQSSNLMSKWLGDTDKILARMLRAAGMIGGILAIDEFQRFIPKSDGSGESGGVENRMGGALLTWFNDQNTNLVLSAANNVSHLPDEFTRSGRVDVMMFVGFPGEAAKNAAWDMYIRHHELDQSQDRPKDDYWTPADIMNCCRLAEQQQTTVKRASRWITPSYEKNRKQMDELMDWAEQAGCICAETGERFEHPRKKNTSANTKRVSRKVKMGSTQND